MKGEEQARPAPHWVGSLQPGDSDFDDGSNDDGGSDGGFTESESTTDGFRASQRAGADATFNEEEEDDDELLSESDMVFRDGRWREQARAYGREFFKRMPYYLPVVGWLPRYQWKRQLLPDTLAGLAVGGILVPQCIAYSSIVGVEPIVGLYSGWMTLVIYSLLGSNRFTAAAAGPEGVLALLIQSSLKQFASKNGIAYTTETIAPYASLFAILVGVFLVLLGLLRVGFLDNLTSRSILAGFVSASACILMLEQVGTLWDIKLHGEYSYEKLDYFFRHFLDVNVFNLCLGIASLLLMVACEHLKTGLGARWRAFLLIPSALLVLIFGIAIGVLLDVPRYGVPVLGELESGFPVPKQPFTGIDRKQLTSMIVPSIMIALIAFVKAMAVSKFFGVKYSFQVSPNRELVALGMSNFIGGFFQSFPITPSLPRSVISDLAGSTSQMTGVVASFIVLATCLFLMPVFKHLPKTTIAAIILFAASKLIELDDILYLFRMHAWIETALALLTFVITFLFGPEIGILVALGLSLMTLIKAATYPGIGLLGRVKDDMSVNTRYRDITLFRSAEQIPGVLMVVIDGPLFFWNVSMFRDVLRRAELLGSHRAHPTDPTTLDQDIAYVFFECRNLSKIDAQALQVLASILEDFQSRAIAVGFANLAPHLRYDLLQACSAVSKKEIIGFDSFAASMGDLLHSFDIDKLGGDRLLSSTYEFLI